MSPTFLPPPLRLAAACLVAALATPGGLAHDALGEYFFDDDPGIGAATPLPLPTPPPALADLDTLAIQLPANPANASVNFGLRFRNPAGDWGPTTLRRVHLIGGSGAPDVSLRWGSAAPVVVTPGADGTITLTRPAPAAGDSQADRLLVQPLLGSAQGAPQASRVFPIGRAVPARLYYAVDQRPDPSVASFLELNEIHRLAPSALDLNLGSSAPGFHTLHLLLQDGSGHYTEESRHLHITPTRVQSLAGLAYAFHDTNGAPLSDLQVAPLHASTSEQDVSLAVPAGLAKGEYTLVLNLADASGDLLFTQPAPLSLSAPGNPAYAAWATQLGLDGADGDMLADPDGDRLVNLLEFAFGTYPHLAQSTPPHSVIAWTSFGATHITVSYPQREGGVGDLGRDYTVDGLRYTVEASWDLETWLPFDDFLGITASRSRDSNGNGIETVIVQLYVNPLLTSAKRVFVRLNVSVVP